MGTITSVNAKTGAVTQRALTAGEQLAQQALAASVGRLPSGAPAVVDMAQARLALLQAGLLDQVQAAIDAMPGVDGQAARIAWEYRSTVRRDSPLLQALAAQLKLSEQRLDELFTAAASL